MQDVKSPPYADDKMNRMNGNKYNNMRRNSRDNMNPRAQWQNNLESAFTGSLPNLMSHNDSHKTVLITRPLLPGLRPNTKNPNDQPGPRMFPTNHNPALESVSSRSKSTYNLSTQPDKYMNMRDFGGAEVNDDDDEDDPIDGDIVNGDQVYPTNHRSSQPDISFMANPNPYYPALGQYPVNFGPPVPRDNRSPPTFSQAAHTLINYGYLNPFETDSTALANVDPTMFENGQQNPYMQAAMALNLEEIYEAEINKGLALLSRISASELNLKAQKERELMKLHKLTDLKARAMKHRENMNLAISPNGWQSDDRSYYPQRYVMSPTSDASNPKSGSRNSIAGTTFTQTAKRMLMKNNVLPQQYKPQKADLDRFGGGGGGSTADPTNRPLSGIEFVPARPNTSGTDRPASMFFDKSNPQFGERRRSQMVSPDVGQSNLRKYPSQPYMRQASAPYSDEKRDSSSDVSPTVEAFNGTAEPFNINSPNMGEPDTENGAASEHSFNEAMADMTDPEIAEICRPDFTHLSRSARRNSGNSATPNQAQKTRDIDINPAKIDRNSRVISAYRISPSVLVKDSTSEGSTCPARGRSDSLPALVKKDSPGSEEPVLNRRFSEQPKVCIIRTLQANQNSDNMTNGTNSDVGSDIFRARSITPRNTMSLPNWGRRMSSDVITEKREITQLALGPPSSSVGPLVTDTRNGNGQIQSPSWLAVCSGYTSVSIYKLPSRTKLAELTSYLRGPDVPVLRLIPLSSPSLTNTNNQTDDKRMGLLAIVQENGNINICDIGANRIIAHLKIGNPLKCAVIIPHPPGRQNTTPEALLTINRSGFTNMCVWKTSSSAQSKNKDNTSNGNSSNSTDYKSEWELDVLDLGMNIYSRVSEDGSPIDFKYCVCAQKPIKSNSKPGPPNAPNTDSSKSGFLLITASLLYPKQPNVTILRISTWILQSNKLHVHGCVDKVLNRQTEYRLVDVNYVENGSAASLCVCLTTEVLWLSLKSLDLLSTLRLPACIQPAQFLSAMWPPATLSHVLNRGRLWIATTNNRLVELAAFESQRRRNINGRGCLLMLHVAVTDASVSSLSCTSGDSSMIVAGTTKGEVHISRVPEHCYGCMITSCPLGSSTKDDLVHHILRDHYLSTTESPSLDDLRCRWNGCGFILQENGVSVNFEALESHARQHVFQ